MCKQKVKWVCSECGEESIYWERTAYWDTDSQSFEIGGDLNDAATTFCGNCGDEDTGKEVTV